MANKQRVEKYFKGIKYWYQGSKYGYSVVIEFKDIGPYKFYVTNETSINTCCKKTISEYFKTSKKEKDLVEVKDTIKRFLSSIIEDVDKEEIKPIDVKAIEMKKITSGSLFIPRDTDILTIYEVIIVLSEENNKVLCMSFVDENEIKASDTNVDLISGVRTFYMDTNTISEEYLYIDNNSNNHVKAILDKIKDIKKNTNLIKTQVTTTVNSINNQDPTEDFISKAIEAISKSTDYNGYQKYKMINAILEKK